MGMGNYSCHADTVSDEFVRETCPDEMDNLQTVLDESDCDFGHLGRTSNDGDIQGGLDIEIGEENSLAVLNAYDDLCVAFEKKTGLELEIKYHEADDRGDEVDGFFWAVEGVYVFSPAGEKYKDKIKRKFWTEFG